MENFISRLTENKPLLAKLLTASFLVNLLALATPIYVIQVLQRFVAYGVVSTLVTLVIGISFIIIFEFFFRNIRHRMAREYELKNIILTNQVLDKLISIKSHYYETGSGFRNDLINKNLTLIRNIYSASNILILVDVPFTLIFLIALFLIHYQLGIIVTIFLFIPFLLSKYFRDRISKLSFQGDLLNSNVFRIFDNVISRNLTLKFYSLIKPISAAWNMVANNLANNKENLEAEKNILNSVSTSLNSFLTVFVIGWGAILAVDGQISVGALIGANILAARALMPIIKFTQAQENFSIGKKASDEIIQFLHIDSDQAEGRELADLSGEIAVSNLEFVYPSKKNPVFHNLNFTALPGEISTITGPNGSGKTTLIKILGNILEPTRGQLLIDQIEIAQISTNWLRGQTIYSPQEPKFIDGTLLENIIGSISIKNEVLQSILKSVDLLSFINNHEKGLNMRLDNRGEELPLGIRRRIGHARSLANNGQIVLFDEPTEGLDKTGKDTFYKLIKNLQKQNKTIIISTNDQLIIDISSKLINLNDSFKPTVIVKKDEK